MQKRRYLRIGLFWENLRISVRAIRSNRVRTILTICIIAIGIMALVGILTAIDSIKSSLTNQFTMMGANSFTITSRGINILVNGQSAYRVKNHSRISFREAMEFKERFKEPAIVSVSFFASSGATIKFGSEETNPTISLRGVDENFLSVSGYEINTGRNFSPDEIKMNRRLIIIGSEIARDIFTSGVDPVGK
jgi:putative ABC transport system permease protein